MGQRAHRLAGRPSLFYEDLPVGSTFEGGSRTVSAADVRSFAELTGDDHRLHLDGEYARGAGFAEPIAQGLLVMSLLADMFAGCFDESALAFPGIEGWVFRRPVLVGDVIGARMTITSARRVGRGDRGIVHRWIEVRSADGELRQEGVLPLMVRARTLEA